jgi:hypothetical protein
LFARPFSLGGSLRFPPLLGEDVPLQLSQYSRSQLAKVGLENYQFLTRDSAIVVSSNRSPIDNVFNLFQSLGSYPLT